MQTPLDIIAPLRPNHNFVVPKNFAEFEARFPRYLPGYVKHRMPNATAQEQAARVVILKNRLLTDGDRISRFGLQQTAPHFFGLLNLRLVDRA